MARTKPLLAALLVALVAAGGASAYKIRFNKADQAAARAAVVKRGDLGAAPGWKGGFAKPDINSNPDCAGVPKTADLVTTGASHTAFENGPLSVESEVDILESASMVRTDWARSIKPAFLACLKKEFTKAIGGQGALVSAARIPAPKFAPLVANYRLVFEVTSGADKVRLFIDVLLFAKGRGEGTLLITAPWAARADVRAAELRLGRLMASRIRAA